MTLAETLHRARSAAGLTQTQLAARAGTSQPAVNRYERGFALPSIPTLERLLRACGLELRLQGVPVGKESGPVLSARSGLGPRAAALRRERSRLLELARRRGVCKLRVFGSVARGEDTDESDIDLLAELESGRTLVDLAGFQRDVSEALGVPVDVATPTMLKARIRDEVLAEARPL